MKNELKKSVKTALLLVSTGLLITLFVFFLFFGKGLQLLMPIILFAIFFAVLILFEKLPFIKRHFIIKFIIALILMVFFVKLL